MRSLETVFLFTLLMVYAVVALSAPIVAGWWILQEYILP